MDPTKTKKRRWGLIPLPNEVRGLEDICNWLNFVDGILTAHALTQGSSTELNWFMRSAWEVSPLAYATLKWWLFWVGLRLLEGSVLDGSKARGRILRGMLVLFSMVLVWHVIILRISH